MAELQINGLPAFRAFTEEDNYTAWDYLWNETDAESIIVSTKLFLPDTVEHAGGIFLAEQFHPHSYTAWIEQVKGDTATIERLINHIHLEDILKDAELLDNNDLVYLGECIRRMWEYHLNSKYPDKQFEVTCESGDEGVVVTFCQVQKLLGEASE